MSDNKDFEMQYDMIIVGGGACGLAAAVEAGQNGLNVVVIEKRHSTGGNAMFADGMLAAGSQVQKKQLLDVTPDATLQSAMEYSHQALNARVLRAFINKTADNIRWLENMGVQFHVDPYIPGQVLLTYHIPKGRMKEVMRILKEKIIDLGVPIITDTQVTEILKNETGKVVGVKAKDIEKEFVLHSSNVLVCTGGYSGNKEMLRKYFPFDSKDLICWGLHHNGDGINMVTEAGGANEGLGILCLSGPHVPATVKAKIDIPNEDPCYIAVSALGREPTGVWVNKRGERYVAEQIGLNGHESPNAVIRQPGQLSFALFDSNTIQEMEDHGLIKGLNQDTRNKSIERSHLPGLANQLRMQAEGWIYGEISDPDKCVGCGICVMNCAAGAIKLDTIYAEKNEFSACRYACPLHTDMRSYNHLLRMGRKKEAIEKLKEFHPLPAVTGRICPHFCESECARSDVDKAVNIHQIERFLADEMLKEAPKRVPDTHTERIAIIGSGPSGLSCAYFLKRAGYPVTVFEAMKEPGGMLLNGIPEFRLPNEVVRRQIAYIEKMGVEFKCGCEVGRNVTIEELRGQGYKCFHVAVGLQDGGKLGIPGDDAQGVISGIEFSKRVNLQGERDLQGKVVVIGGGNIAADVARTAVRCGADNVDLYCLEGYDDMPMGQEDRTECEKDGIVIHAGWGQTEVIAPNSTCKGIKFQKCISVRSEEGRFAPKFDDTEVEIRECDTVLYCIGQKVDWGKLLDGTAVEFNPNGTVKGDKLTFQTEEKDIFVGGDAYLGQKFVVHALATGKESAISIDRYLQGKDLSEGRDKPVCKVKNPPHDNMPLLARNDVSRQYQQPRITHP